MTRIEDVRITRFPMQRTDRQWRTASYAANSVEGMAVEILAGHLVGYGATAAHPRQLAPNDLFAQLDGPIRELLLGADSLEGTRIRGELYALGMNARAILAVDIALYDLLGKMAGVPCFNLWGGLLAPAIDVVRMVGIKDLPELEAAVGTLIDEGYRHLKIKIGTTIDEDVDRIAMVRRVFGDGLWIGVDGNGRYDVPASIELCRRLEPYDIALIEQPIAYHDVDGLASLTAASPIPVMADQYVKNASTALEVCQRKAAHVVSVKLTKMGSIDECRRVATICAAFGIGVHIGGSVAPAIVDVAAAQLAASAPGIHLQAEVGEYRAVSGDLFEDVPIVNGRLTLETSRPGFGVDLAEVTATAANN